MTNKSVISAMLGIALMAMPMTAAARSNKDGRHFNRGPAPAFHPAPRSFHPAPAPRFAPVRPMAPAAFRPVPRANFAPRYNAPRFTAPVSRPMVAPVIPVRNNIRTWQPAPPPANPSWIPPGHRRADYMYARHQEPDADDFRTVCDNDGDDCRQVPNYREGYGHGYWKHHRYQYGAPAYAPNYSRGYDSLPYTCDEDGDDCRPNTMYQGGYSDIYGSNPQYYFMPMPGEQMMTYRDRLIRGREIAMMKYRRAVARGDKTAARHLYNAVEDLNRRIGAVNRKLNRRAYSYAPAPSTYAYSGLGSYTAPYANSYGYDPYGYSNPGAMSTIVGPILQNFVP
jgi:hypothetical protein